MTMPKVAIIDDDDELREMLGNILRDEGFTTQTFSNDNCIQELETLAPDLIVVDYWLSSDHTSESFIKNLKMNQKLKSIPIVLMSNDRTVEKKKNDPLANVFLPKPFAIEKFISTLRTFLK